MSAPLLLSIKDAYVTYGKKALFEELSFNIHEGNKICLIGNNGAGKTTLMHLVAGTKELDGGERWQQPGIDIGYLEQKVDFDPEETVFDFVYNGLKEDKRNPDYEYMVDMVIDPLSLKPEDKMGNLSGGQLRRASLAKSLIEECEILMLDEPTNHLDLEAIEWLEDYIRNYNGTIICVSHDKRFLENISDKVFWLDRGKIRVCPRGFKYFEEWSEELLAQEKRELDNRQRVLDVEVAWASKGVKARRKRNVRRLEEVKKAKEQLKADKSRFNKITRKIELKPLKDDDSSRMVSELYNVSKEFTEKGRERKILDKFSFRMMKGDRIGIVGKNGAGKSTFLKMLIGELEADSGTIKLGKTLNVSYFDQNRRDINPKNSLWETLCPGGGDHIEVAGKQMHVCGYLRNFMFDPSQAREPVGTLSGGQQNRLMLAKVLAKPGGLLILDEPTNDLDMETLEMLEEILSNYKGTLIIVSHDRDFLDQTVSQIIAFEGDAIVDTYIGGYSDYLTDREERKRERAKEAKKKKKELKQQEQQSEKPKKLSYNLQFELENIPKQLEELQSEMDHLQKELSDPEFYNGDREEVANKLKKSAETQEKINELEARWLEIEAMKG